jgi:hypothetical protein
MLVCRSMLAMQLLHYCFYDHSVPAVCITYLVLTWPSLTAIDTTDPGIGHLNVAL